VSVARTIGWSVSLGIFAAGAVIAAVASSLSEENKRRAADSAQLLRDRAVDSVEHLRDRTVETALDLRDQWSETALEVRDRWTTTAEEVRARTVDTAQDWRDRSTEGIERALRTAAEARDESLAALDDDDEDPKDAPRS
jgi:hypothetical protein